MVANRSFNQTLPNTNAFVGMSMMNPEIRGVGEHDSQNSHSGSNLLSRTNLSGSIIQPSNTPFLPSTYNGQENPPFGDVNHQDNVNNNLLLGQTVPQSTVQKEFFEPDHLMSLVELDITVQKFAANIRSAKSQISNLETENSELKNEMEDLQQSKFEEAQKDEIRKLEIQISEKNQIQRNCV